MMIPVTRKVLDATKRVDSTPSNPQGQVWTTKTEHEKVIMEENPLTGEITMHWTGTDNFGGDVVRQINFKPGEAGYQKFGVDDAEAAAQGVTEYKRVKVEEPEFNYMEPNQADPERADVEFLDIFTEGDDVIAALEKLAGKKVVTKETEAAEKEIQKNLYKDIQGEEAIIPEPEGVGISDKGDVFGEE